MKGYIFLHLSSKMGSANIANKANSAITPNSAITGIADTTVSIANITIKKNMIQPIYIKWDGLMTASTVSC